MFYPVIKHLPGQHQQELKELQRLEDFIAKKVEQSRRTLDPNCPRNFIDSFLIRMQEVHPRSQRSEVQSQAEGNQAGGGGEQRPIQIIPPSQSSLQSQL